MTKFADIPLNKLLNDLAESRMDCETHLRLGCALNHTRVRGNKGIIDVIVKELKARGESVPESKWIGVP